MKLKHSVCCVLKNQLLPSQLQFAKSARSSLNITYRVPRCPRKERGGSSQKGEVGDLQVNFALEPGELTSLSYKGEVVCPKVEGSVEM